MRIALMECTIIKCRDGYYIIKYHNRVNMALKEVPCFPEVKKILTMVEKR